MLSEVPEYEQKLKDGRVNETQLGKVHVFLNQQKKKNKKAYSKDEKLKLLKAVEGKPPNKPSSF